MQAQDRIADRYELTYPLGRGGMGEVWAGYDEKLDRPVAIKFLRRVAAAEEDRNTAIERFMREARVTARLDHPGVPAVHDIGFHDDDIYIVMQLVPGMVLGELIAERDTLSVPWTAAIGAQICSVLAAAHSASLVHRDIKPPNLMVTPTGTVKVLDFGVAALLGPADVPRLTVTGRTPGTPTYMAPEQALNGAVGPRTDLYALGCVLFEALAGVPPYRAENSLAMLHQHLNNPIPSVTEHRADVPDALTNLLTRLLAKDPQDRPPSAAEVYAKLVPFATVEIGFTDTRPTVTVNGQPVDPTMPHRFPFGPLPVTTTSAPTRVDSYPATATGPAVGPPSMRELSEIQERARALAEEERFTQAAETLQAVLRRAIKEYGATEPQILDLRLDLANMLVLAGAYRQALPEFVGLARDLTGRPTVDRLLVRHCRQQVATCQDALGEVTEALATLRTLLADERRILPPDDPELFEPRHQLAVYTAKVREVSEARQQIAELLRDVRDREGPESPYAIELEALLAHLTQLARVDRSN